MDGCGVAFAATLESAAGTHDNRGCGQCRGNHCRGLKSSATITVKTSDNGSTIVYVTGVFEVDDDKRFESATASLSSQVLVTFQFRGRQCRAGILMGTHINLKGFTTYVGSGAVYASACGVAWVSGKRRAPAILILAF
jgi:hypothetical protein